MRGNDTIGIFFLAVFIMTFAACRGVSDKGSAGKTASPGTIRVAQSGEADVIGTDNVALQKAADMLRPGDTLEIGPGTYEMHNSLFVPSRVTVRGVRGETILKKSKGVESFLTDDGDYGESQLTVADPVKFSAGMGLSVLDDTLNSGWDISVTTIRAVEGNVLRVQPMTLRDYNVEEQHARVRNTFPILCAIQTEGVVFEDLIVDGNKDENAYIDGCRGGAIYLYISRDATIRNCVARNHNGDGISFQITENIQVLDSESHGHTGYGIHPGTGSDRPTVKGCRIHDNGQVGLFLCWRVRHGSFLDNLIENNGRYGISIGHKDTDNTFVNNTISGSGHSGVYFRKETLKNSGHRNTFRQNRVLNNGNPELGYGFYLEPHARDIVIVGNRIAETRSGEQRTQRYGIYLAAGAAPVQAADNLMEGHTARDYFEAK
ncbi:MAG: right-handed parallel beta-helix repeat-containing protein [Acidobacteria bacterium]|nr:right-handed parallel beta-helix repeat-containing protein [Acidobacteriota bacterium]